jgi:hypothetical protein
MKNLFKLIVLLALNNGLKAQNNNQINVSRPNVNILYVGLDNNITIESIDGKNHDYLCELYKWSSNYFGQDSLELEKYDNATITKEGPQRFNINISSKTGDLHLLIKEKVDGNIVIRGSSNYKVRGVPMPILDLGNALTQSGAIDLAQLKKLKNLNVKLENFSRTDISYKVLSYKFTAISKERGFAAPISVQGNRLDKIMPALNQLRKGDDIKFTDILVEGPNNKILLLNSVIEEIDGGLNGIYREFDDQLKTDSINNINIELSHNIDYGRTAKLTKSSLVKNLVEYYKFQNFNNENPYFKKNIIRYEFKNGRFEKYEFNETLELNRIDGLAIRDTIKTLVINPGVDPENIDFEDPNSYHDSAVVRIKNNIVNKIYFDEILNNMTNIKEWYLFAEYNQRTIAIPVTEFSKERVIFPQIVASYLDYLRKNSARQYDKYRTFHNQGNQKDSITKGRISFFENVAEHQLSKMYYKLITGTKDGFYDVFGGNNNDELYLKSWGKLLDSNNFKPLTSYAPEWYDSDSMLRFSSASISHSALVQSVAVLTLMKSSEDKITGEDKICHFIPLNVSGFDVLTKINVDGSTSSLLMVKIVLDEMNLSYYKNFYIPISKVFGLFDDVEKIMISDIYKFGYSNFDFLKN